MKKKTFGRVHDRVARFFLVQHTKTGKIYQKTIQYTKQPQNIPNGRKIDQHIPLQVPPKFTHIMFLGLKIRHLATLVQGTDVCCFRVTVTQKIHT
jgi:hypothetical protein